MLFVKSSLTLVSYGILKNQNIIQQRFNSFLLCRFASSTSSMKRTRTISKANSVKIKDNVSKDETETKLEDIEYIQAVQAKNLQNKELKDTLDALKNENEIIETTQPSIEHSTNDDKNSNPKQKDKLNLKSLKDRNKNIDEELKPNTLPPKNKLRAVVDLKMMTEELKQLEDPPSTAWEKNLSSNRLPFSFFDSPCEELAQNLLGKILVRCLENGTLLKGRIVETEGYLGVVDKASHTYRNKVTQRNIPMYMQPGTIYVYMTYGMYHCFNISSQEPGAHVLIKTVEPTLGFDYMELLRNMQTEINKKEKKIVKNVQRIKPHELCNSPSKICTAFVIDEDTLNEKKIYDSNELWIERDPYVKFTTIVAAPPNDSEDNECEGCAVLVRAVEPLEGIECMNTQRTTRGESNVPKKPLKNLKIHELCNGPSKLCMAFQLHKSHSKYSLCSWKGLWIENSDINENIKIVKCPRIGIDNYGEEWTDKPLRYYIHGNRAVSKRNKIAESLLKLN